MFFISLQVFLVSSHTLGQLANVLRPFADVIKATSRTNEVSM